MKKLRFFPYKMGSQGCKELARRLGALRVYPDGNYLHRATHLVINWGNSIAPRWNVLYYNMVNRPDKVGIASNKLHCLAVLHEHLVPAVEYTTDVREAMDWVTTGSVVYARKILNGSEGRGIVVVQPQPEPIMPTAPLYTKRPKVRAEYRIHVVNNKVIDAVQKKKMTTEKMEAEGFTYDKYVKNHRNGWVFARDGIDIPQEVKDVAVQALMALSLDFGAVDIIYTPTGEALVLEVNTAPGLEGTTLERYTVAFKELAHGHQN